jgi:hypothetical protein
VTFKDSLAGTGHGGLSLRTRREPRRLRLPRTRHAEEWRYGNDHRPPVALARTVRLRAIQKGRDLKSPVTDLVRIGPAASGVDPDTIAPPTVTTDPKTRLPMIECPAKPCRKSR